MMEDEALMAGRCGASCRVRKTVHGLEPGGRKQMLDQNMAGLALYWCLPTAVHISRRLK